VRPPSAKPARAPTVGKLWKSEFSRPRSAAIFGSHASLSAAATVGRRAVVRYPLIMLPVQDRMCVLEWETHRPGQVVTGIRRGLL
jgi:hypothetical protein